MLSAIQGGSVGTVTADWLLLFGGGALLLIALLQGMRLRREKGRFTANFAKLYGLILIATLGSVLVLAEVDAEARTGAFTLLGTIAGHLAASRSPGVSKKDSDSDAGPDNDIGEQSL